MIFFCQKDSRFNVKVHQQQKVFISALKLHKILQTHFLGITVIYKLVHYFH